MRERAQKLVTALRYAALKAQQNGWSYWQQRFEGLAREYELNLQVEILEQIRPVLKAVLGYDALEGDTHLKGEKQQDLTATAPTETPSLQDLRRRIYTKAKAEPAWRSC